MCSSGKSAAAEFNQDLKKNLERTNINLLLDLFFVALPLEPLQRLSAVALLGLALLLKDLDGLIEGLDGCTLHL